jgi:hypothetical protein
VPKGPAPARGAGRQGGQRYAFNAYGGHAGTAQGRALLEREQQIRAEKAVSFRREKHRLIKQMAEAEPQDSHGQ